MDYPSGTTLDGDATGLLPFRVWLAEPGPTVTADSKFIADLIDSLSVRYNIDPTRIFANGLSNGGGMAFALSCADASSRDGQHCDRGALSRSAILMNSTWSPDGSQISFVRYLGSSYELFQVSVAGPATRRTTGQIVVNPGERAA